MRSGRFVDLYVSETREHLQLLTRSILALERGDAGAVDEAFRAAHTIKGLAAAMGHGEAADHAHRLEDTLSGVRGGAAVDAQLTDGLLAAVDGMEAAIDAALRTGADAEGEASAAGGEVAGGDQGDTPGRDDDAARTAASSAPAGTSVVVVVRLSKDAVLPEARAELIRRAVSRQSGVLRIEPGAGEPFEGVLRVFVDGSADVSQIEAAASGQGDVASVTAGAVAAAFAAPRAAERHASDEGTAPAAGSDGRWSAASVRVARAKLDEMAEGIAELSVLHARAAQSADQLTSHRAAAVLSSLQRTILELRMVPVSTALDRVARLVRDAARAAAREVDFEVAGGEIELDQAVLDALVDPLVHLLRNAVDHGIEAPAEREAAGKPRRGRIRIDAVRERNAVRMEVIDDGRGVNGEAVAVRGRELGLIAENGQPGEDEILRLLFQPGFTTTDSVTELSGRGVGLDVVAGRIRGLGGAIEVSTSRGEGTTFTLRVPVSLALAHSLRIGVGDEQYALPITHVKEVVALEGANAGADTRGTVTVRGGSVPVVDLGRVLGVGGGSPSAVVIAELGERRVALAVDRVIGHEQIVVKPFDAPVGALPVFSGATILADGRPALLIDPLSMV